MLRYLLIATLLFANIACSIGDSAKSVAVLPPQISESTPTPDNEVVENQSVESFQDENQIGRAGKNRIVLEIIEKPSNDMGTENKLARVEFYSMSETKGWNLKQTLEIESHALMEAQPSIEDFNNDGHKDFTFISNTAARGANEVRTLLIYDKRSDRLIHIKNSEEFPNLAFNKTLNCIDAWMFHGATSTVFLRLDGDMLKQFASVDTGAELTVTITDKYGKHRVIRREKMKEEDIFNRYETYDPLVPATLPR